MVLLLVLFVSAAAAPPKLSDHVTVDNNFHFFSFCQNCSTEKPLTEQEDRKLHEELCANKSLEVVHQFVTWHEAVAQCEERNKSLLTIIDYCQHMKAVHKILGSGGNALKDYWIGASDLKFPFMYYWYPISEPVLYANYAPGEPNYYHLREHCLAMSGLREFKWIDSNCDHLNYFVCETYK